MLISNSLIFVHNPRTGGTSVRKQLRKALPNHYFPAADSTLTDEQKTWIYHQGLTIAFEYVEKLGLDPYNIPALVCIRNPYSLTLSGYKYLIPRMKRENKDLEDSFTDYLVNLDRNMPSSKRQAMASAPYGPFSGFLLIGDKTPSNLTIARTESLGDDVAKFLAKLNVTNPGQEFPHQNKSEHVHFSHYFTAKEEQIVYDMYRNTFESGLYERYQGLDSERL